MHELPVTQNILELALTYGANAGATKITRLYITIGDLASIVDDSVQFYWELIAKDTIAEKAELEFHRIKTELRCKNCSQTYKPVSGISTCPNCQSSQIEILSGKEFYLEAIDIEK